MNKIVTIIGLFLFTTAIYAQKEKKHTISLQFGGGKSIYSNGALHLYKNVKMKGNSYISAEIDYAYRTSPTTDFCVGLSANLCYLDCYTGWGGSSLDKTGTEYFGIFSVPLYLKYRFGKCFFATPGINVNYHPSQGYTWGMGLQGGVGAEYTLKSGFVFSFAPQIKLNLLSIGKTDKDSRGTDFTPYSDTLIQIGARLGIGYKF